MSTYQWLLFLHITGAFLFAGGTVAAFVFNFAALMRPRPSNVVVFFKLAQLALVALAIGSFMTLGFGLWLVHEAPWGYSYGEAWIVAAIVLWFVGAALGGAGGRRDRETRELAERLAGEDDAPSSALTAHLRDPITLALSYGSGLTVFAILALMIWKPGA